MCADFCGATREARDVLRQSEPILGEDLNRTSTTDEAAPELDPLPTTPNGRSTPYQTGTLCPRSQLAARARRDGAAGHSMGIVAALVAAGAMSMEDSRASSWLGQDDVGRVRRAARQRAHGCLMDDSQPCRDRRVGPGDLDRAAQQPREGGRSGTEAALAAFHGVAGQGRAASPRTAARVQGAYHTQAFAACRGRRARARGDSLSTPRIPVFMGTSGAAESDPSG